MNSRAITLVAYCLIMAACKEQTAEQQPIQCIAAKVTIGDKQIDSVIQWNVMNGEARLLNAASFSDKSTGKQGSLIGWVPLVDLQKAVMNLSNGGNPPPVLKTPEPILPIPTPSDQSIAPVKHKNKLSNH